MSAQTILSGLAACGALLAASGCAGARTKLVAPDSQYPVSFTRGLRGDDGELVPADRRHVVGKFTDSRTAWAFLYAGINVTPTKDLSDSINEQVKAAGGDAIVHLRVGSAHCALDYFFPLTFLPIWPGCTNVYVEGEIVRVTPSARSSAELSPRGDAPRSR